MSTTPTVENGSVGAASALLYEVLSHKYGPLDLGAQQPLVKAISEYGQKCRERDEDGIN